MAGMGDLGDEKRAGRVGNVRATAHDESADEVQRDASRSVTLLRKALHKGSNNNDNAANSCAFLSAQPVGDIWSEEEDKETSETGHKAAPSFR
jgi:hypothetical protein